MGISKCVSKKDKGQIWICDRDVQLILMHSHIVSVDHWQEMALARIGIGKNWPSMAFEDQTALI
jgi:hypothetical protein